jgi:murein DD-endopeptidase MepM/ murein hydrolase activator NlpD
MPSSTVRRAALICLTTAAVATPAAAQAASGTGGTPVGSPAPTTTAAPAATTATPATVSETRTVKLTRSQTKSVQRKAKVKPDGSLGSRTRTAIKRYQSKKRLVRTGRPNLQTLKAMKLSFARKIEQRLAATQRASAPAPSSVPGYVFPIQGSWKFGGPSTAFGDRGGAHQGIDLFARCGTPLVAASAGEVRAVDYQSAAGNYVVLTGTPTGEDQAYMHLKAPSSLKPGDTVAAGDPVGLVGDTGNADGCHLHFELWTAPGWYAGGHPRDPRKDLVSWGG